MLHDSISNQVRVNYPGIFQYGGTANSSKRVDVQKYREGRSFLVHTLEISDDNTFSFQVPPDYGKILIIGLLTRLEMVQLQTIHKAVCQ